MEWVKETRPEIRWLVSLATDTPMVPEDLVARLLAAVTAEGADIAFARSGQFDHPVFGLWPVRLADDLRRALIEENLRKLGQWCARYQVARVLWQDGDADPFFNINTPEDVARFRRMTPADASSSE
jgi:molybdopterin-guanine dinucleotide biosynthesis protein A